MALKDRFDKIISYFDTDDVSENEVHEVQERTSVQRDSRAATAQEASQRSHMTNSAEEEMIGSRPRTYTYDPNRQERQRVQRDNAYQQATPRVQNKDSVRQQREQVTIALKYPRKYEDAQEIVDLLIVNECVLIDFQYMLDAQARRCLDYIDGASRVLYGSLQKVGSSMFLLTPANVMVDIEEMNIPKTGQETSFDFDMKRR
ncbi:TPA: cell division protein SepF [Streptococcus agalactiae]|jgi:Uncharacterized protein conserved in bacteria|uniref:Cell division protein SepF n=2 Tax=Streptococcus agalactiae TaxID=1311 RepID=SEPF_STRA5|nr:MULTISPECIES: cell division protein SepF [Streptococcus]Q8E181.1 RecName: Full=Cell division protein SepF [Streptococcus agalactiae 2603V/R]EAO62870.1 ylmF protein [Streptococcus agalactiae 18RS21]EPX00054.1 cell division protein SepF [Streptococcus agalactiae MRI Z1-049]HEO8207712.1 cell division protein SepF [Streptococcus agalactiae ADL-350]AAM99383.1 ylmF protein [Streptococcus agalactiae 2603V/R]AIF86033.1 cell division protein SepF [Streptococcus agalactiae]